MLFGYLPFYLTEHLSIIDQKKMRLFYKEVEK